MAGDNEEIVTASGEVPGLLKPPSDGKGCTLMAA